MRTRLFLVALAAMLLSAGAATAHNGHGKIRYSFLGRLTAAPSNGGVSITVEGGNKQALRAMLGRPVTQTFAYDATTEFLEWSKGVPAVVDASALAAGDYVRVNVRAPRRATLEEIERVPAGIVGDHGTKLYTPTQPLFLFRGTLTGVGASSVSIDVKGGNRRALRLLVGSSSTQTFAFGDDTIFLLWQGKVPSVIDSSKLAVGDRVVIRIRAARGSSLARVTATPARRVAEREPAAAT